jgi:GPH family glycoside/pentoside/hexuronide:cation symporter
MSSQLKLAAKLTFKLKLLYGLGQLGFIIPVTIQLLFLLFFMTEVVGLSPGLAGGVLVIANIWDAVSDPIVGELSDRTQSRWGRRYPWIIIATPIFALFFILRWILLPLDSQIGLFVYYSAISICAFTAFTAMIVPFSTLASEITQTYDERTSLTSFTASFEIVGVLIALGLAQIVFLIIPDPQQKYFVTAIIGIGIAWLAMYISAWGTYPYAQKLHKQRSSERPTQYSLREKFKTILSNHPFLLIIGIYLFSSMGSSITISIFPYYIRSWMQLPDHYFTFTILIIQVTTLLMFLIWNPLGQRLGKKTIYLMGIPMCLIAQLGLWFLQPGQVNWLYICAIIYGAGASVGYLIPLAMVPDVIDLDQLRTGQRREGIFYGFVVFLAKLSQGFAIFLVGKVLDWVGYIPKTAANLQPDNALLAIRTLIAPIPAIFLIGGLVLIYFYPITKSIHEEILSQLPKN